MGRQGKYQTYSTIFPEGEQIWRPRQQCAHSRKRSRDRRFLAPHPDAKELPPPRVLGVSDAPRQTTLSSSARRHRPTIAPLSQPALRQTPPAARTIFNQTEDTPNADALKFKPNHQVLPDDFPSSFLEYLSPRSTLAPPHPSPLAAQLLQVDGVTSVFYGRDYITVTKDSATPWAHVKPEVFSMITEAVTSGQQIVNTVAGKAEDGQDTGETQALYDPEDEEIVGMIQELLETRIRPAIQEDGGDIEFRGFQDGQVMLKLRGACRTCDSSM